MCKEVYMDGASTQFNRAGQFRCHTLVLQCTLLCVSHSGTDSCAIGCFSRDSPLLRSYIFFTCVMSVRSECTRLQHETEGEPEDGHESPAGKSCCQTNSALTALPSEPVEGASSLCSTVNTFSPDLADLDTPSVSRRGSPKRDASPKFEPKRAPDTDAEVDQNGVFVISAVVLQ